MKCNGKRRFLTPKEQRPVSQPGGFAWSKTKHLASMATDRESVFYIERLIFKINLFSVTTVLTTFLIKGPLHFQINRLGSVTI